MEENGNNKKFLYLLGLVRFRTVTNARSERSQTLQAAVKISELVNDSYQIGLLTWGEATVSNFSTMGKIMQRGLA